MKRMNKTKVTTEPDKKLTVDIVGLQALTGLGRASATKIGQDAKAVIYVGRRRLFFVPKVAAYLEGLTQS